MQARSSGFEFTTCGCLDWHTPHISRLRELQVSTRPAYTLAGSSASWRSDPLHARRHAAQDLGCRHFWAHIFWKVSPVLRMSLPQAAVCPLVGIGFRSNWLLLNLRELAHAKFLENTFLSAAAKHTTGTQKWGFPKIRDTILGVPIIRTIVFWGLYWGPPILGNYQVLARGLLIGLLPAHLR